MKPILPGSAIGVLGSGQLGRMFAIAARRMGYRVHTLSPDQDTPTGQVADLEINAPYEDLDAIAKFAAGVSVVTFEFENVPAATAAAAERCARFVRRGIFCTRHNTGCGKKLFFQTRACRSLRFAVSPAWKIFQKRRQRSDYRPS